MKTLLLVGTLKLGLGADYRWTVGLVSLSEAVNIT